MKSSDKKFIANGNAHFIDKEAQEFYGQQIIYFSNSEDIEVNGSGTATIKIPEKYRKDIDRALERVKGKKPLQEPEDVKPAAKSGGKQEGEEAGKAKAEAAG